MGRAGRQEELDFVHQKDGKHHLVGRQFLKQEIDLAKEHILKSLNLLVISKYTYMNSL